MRALEERLKLNYSNQVEFIRFRECVRECELKIEQVEITLKFLRLQKSEALVEIERLFQDNDQNI